MYIAVNVAMTVTFKRAAWRVRLLGCQPVVDVLCSDTLCSLVCSEQVSVH